MSIVNIALADDQLLFRQGIASIINNNEDFKLLFEAEHGVDFINKLQITNQLPDIAILDMEMPEMDGVELTKHLQTNFPSIKIIILSVHTKERLISRMIQLGASGYLAKNCDKAELIHAINTTFKFGFYFNEQVLKVIQNSQGKRNLEVTLDKAIIDLSEREKEILLHICKERNNNEIAELLFISPRTVEGHRNNLLSKTGCRNTAGLVLFAVRYKIYELITVQ